MTLAVEAIATFSPLAELRGLTGAGRMADVGGVSMRERVLANIAESKQARGSSNIGTFFAREDQVLSGYKADNWSGVTLNKDSVVYALSPGKSAYFTDFSTVQASNLDSYSLSQALQVKPSVRYGYRPDVTGFRVTQDISVPSGRALANTDIGSGGGVQYFINSAEKYLEPISTINLRMP